MQIWDTAGQEKVSKFRLFDNLNNWREEFLIQVFRLVHLILKTFRLLCWENKVDVDGGNSRVVSEKKAKAWCASKGNIPYFETSAKEGFNVDAAFECIAKNALKNEPEEEIYLPEPSMLLLGDDHRDLRAANVKQVIRRGFF
ncbi:hypothetical protein GQ457_HM001980 [Hibiscus cannabinus]